MAEQKTKPTSASVTKFLNSVADETRRQDCFAVLEMMRGVTKEEPVMWGPSIVGFGLYHYKYASGHEGEWPIAAFSPRKGDLTLYFSQGFETESGLMEHLGKYKTGKSCLYIKKLADVDPKVLKRLVTWSVKRMAGQRIKS